MNKYEPLRQFFSCANLGIGEMTLSFSEVEGILGFKLPKSAYEYRAWWSNPSSSTDHPYAQSWLAAGWMVDSVSQKDKWVRLRRIQLRVNEKRTPLIAKAPPSFDLQKEIVAEGSRALTTDYKRFLLNYGFEEVGEWLLEKDSLQFVLTQQGNEQNILYAFVVQEKVVYIGKSNRTLRGRMNSYKHPGPTQNTNIKNNARIKASLLKGIPVQILVFVQREEMLSQGIPINLAAGLEDNLIARIRPLWNKRI